jgi:hypothetical protein
MDGSAYPRNTRRLAADRNAAGSSAQPRIPSADMLLPCAREGRHAAKRRESPDPSTRKIKNLKLPRTRPRSMAASPRHDCAAPRASSQCGRLKSIDRSQKTYALT